MRKLAISAAGCIAAPGGETMAQLLAEIVAAGGVVPMLLKEGYIHAEPFTASSS